MDELEVKRLLDDYMTIKGVASTSQRYQEALAMVARKAPVIIAEMPVPTPQPILAFLADLKRQSAKPSVLRFYFFFLKSLTEKTLRGTWPLTKKDIPPLPEDGSQARPIHDEQIINAMIQKMKTCPSLTIKTLFAISTTFGNRRVELATFDQHSIEPTLETIHVRTRKHGDARTHLIPKEIKPYITPDSLFPIPDWEMTATYRKIEEFCGIPHINGFGWHSIRRRLITWFDDRNLPETDIYRFMRWKRRKTILDTYIVRTPKETDRRLAQVDRRMFRCHPFLSAWGSTTS